MVIKHYIDQSLENGLLVEIPTDQYVALSPVFPLVQSAGKTHIITDQQEANKHLVCTPRAIPIT